MDEWEIAQDWERSWWGSCVNTLNEEQKQLTYASRMGLIFSGNPKTQYEIDLQGKAVLDIGGGPTSLLLKTRNGSRLTVVDPIDYPKWVRMRYDTKNIVFTQMRGEDLRDTSFGPKYDEVWIYNCLQHTEDPELIVKNARDLGVIVRIFEWLDTEPNVGHPQVLTEKKLNLWLNGEGKTQVLKGEHGCYGKSYFGIFRGV